MRASTGNPNLTVDTFRLVGAAFLLSLLVFNAGRLALIAAYGNLADINEHIHYFLNDYFYAFRLDLKTAAAMSVIPVLACYPLDKFAPAAVHRFFIRLTTVYFLCYLFACLLMTIIGFYYYGVYGNYIDVFIFQIFNRGNGMEVAKSLYHDFSLVNFFLIAGLGSFILHIANKAASRKIPLGRLDRYTGFTWLLGLFLMALLARGAITERPLSKQRAILSPDPFSNQLVSNGVMALFVAADQYGNDDISYLAASDDAVTASFQRVYGETSNKIPEPADFNRPLPGETIPTAQANVVISLMESFGSLLLEFDATDNDVLGQLRNHFANDHLFLNFLSEGNDTVPSLERLVTYHDLQQNLSQTGFRTIRFASSIAAFFQSQGYRTVFITGGKKNWSDFDSFLPAQGFDEIYDEFTILEQVPDARKSWAWGVYDEDLYKYAYQVLSTESSKPLFIFLLTMTNHSPYDLPADYTGYPINLNRIPGISPLLAPEEAESIIRAYQYANDALGNFMTMVKRDERLKNDTVVAATGDHYLRYLFNYPDFEPIAKAKVPFYLYLPTQYATNIHEDPVRPGSHKDIFPTIAGRLFPGENIYAFGNDLLAAAPPDTEYFGYNRDFSLGRDNIYIQHGVDSQRREEEEHPANEKSAGDLDPRGKLKTLTEAYVTLRRYFTYQQLQQ